MVAIDPKRLRLRDALEQANLTAYRHYPIAHGDEYGGGHVDVGDPFTRVELADRPPSLQHHAPVVQRGLLNRPRLPLAALALQVELLREPLPGLRRSEAGQGCHARQADEAQLLLAGREEVRRSGAQREPTDALGVPAPDELSDRTTHRVTDRDDLVDAEHVAHGKCIVGAVLQAEGLLRTDAAAVAAVIERNHSIMTRERPVTREPVEVRARCPAVQQQQGRRVGWPGHGAHEGGASSGQLHRRPVRHVRHVRGRCCRLAVADGHHITLPCEPALRRAPLSAPVPAACRWGLGTPPTGLRPPPVGRRRWATEGS